MKIKIFIFMWLVLVQMPVYALDDAEVFFDFGVFAFEEEDYPAAEAYFKKALELDSENPFYHYYMGKTLLNTGRYPESMEYLTRAVDIDSDIPGLKFDLAYLNYEMADYQKAAKLFTEITEQEPTNLLAWYYAGICAQLTGDVKNARKLLEYVKANANSDSVRTNAEKWLQTVNQSAKKLKSYDLYFKLSRQYDDDVRVGPQDQDGAGKGDDDYVTAAYFSGAYHLNRGNYTLSAGYSHYQSWYDEIDDYNLIGSIGYIYAGYNYQPFGFGMTFMPSYYWVDSESYLRSYDVIPQVRWTLNEKLTAALSYTFKDVGYFSETGLDERNHGVFLNMVYDDGKSAARFSAGLGYEDNSASDKRESYDQIKAQLNIYLTPGWDLNLQISGKYIARNYDHTYTFERDDDRYVGSISLSRPVFYEWLNIMLEFDYTKNDSNIMDYDYERTLTSLSVLVVY